MRRICVSFLESGVLDAIQTNCLWITGVVTVTVPSIATHGVIAIDL
jgi:hypothetical protein